MHSKNSTLCKQHETRPRAWQWRRIWWRCTTNQTLTHAVIIPHPSSTSQWEPYHQPIIQILTHEQDVPKLLFNWLLLHWHQKTKARMLMVNANFISNFLHIHDLNIQVTICISTLLQTLLLELISNEHYFHICDHPRSSLSFDLIKDPTEGK